MGIGILYGKESWLEKLPPYQGGGEMIKTVSFEKTTYNELPFKFEAGTPDVGGALGLQAAVEFIKTTGYQQIHDQEAYLLNYASEKLAGIDGFRLIGTATHKASVLSFLIGSIHPYDAGMILDKLGIAVRTGHHCTQPLMDFLKIPGTIRASFAVYNTSDEVDQLAEAILTIKNMFE
jgi:cysteine desulfurase/selenocysteine lyase